MSEKLVTYGEIDRALERCAHHSISVDSDSSGICSACGARVELECLQSYTGRKFYWQKTSIEERTAAHPANQPDRFTQIAPGHWVEKQK